MIVLIVKCSNVICFSLPDLHYHFPDDLHYHFPDLVS